MRSALRLLVLSGALAACQGGSMDNPVGYCDGVTGSCLALRINASSAVPENTTNPTYAILRVKAGLSTTSVPMYTADGSTMATLPVVLPLTPPPGVMASQIKRIEVDGLDMSGNTINAVRIPVSWPDGGHIGATTRIGADSLFGPPIIADAAGISAPTATGDFNGDGKLDFVSVSDVNVSVALGDGTGKFAAATLGTSTAQSITSLVAVDVNRDNRTDVVMAQPGGLIAVSTATSNGSLNTPTTFSVSSEVRTLAAADLNRDGTPDLVVTMMDDTIQTLLGNGSGGFIMKGSASASGIDLPTIADINGDGRPDVVAALLGGPGLYTLIGDGQGGLGTPTPISLPDDALRLQVADINGDSRPDLIVAAGQGFNLLVLLNKGNGNFSAPLTVPLPGFSAGKLLAIDLDNDKLADLIAGPYFDSPFVFLLANGDGSFLQLDQANLSGKIMAADFTGDGRPDLCAYSGAGGPLGVFPNIFQ